MKTSVISFLFATASIALAQDMGHFPDATGAFGGGSSGGGGSRLQFGIGPVSAQNEDIGSDAGFGLNAELGILMDHKPIDMVFGIRAGYIDGLGDAFLDVDIMDVSLLGRVLVPVGADAIKLYGEGRLGFGNLAISGDAKGSAKVGNRNVTLQSDINNDAWTFGWGIGIGIQLDMTRNVGLRIGYDMQSYGDLEALGFAKDPGFVHGGSAALILKF